MINGAEQSIKSGNVYPERGRKCDSCDEEIVCEKRLELAGQEIIQDIQFSNDIHFLIFSSIPF